MIWLTLSDQVHIINFFWTIEDDPVDAIDHICFIESMWSYQFDFIILILST